MIKLYKNIITLIIMLYYIKSLLLKFSINIMYMDYIYNKNTKKNVDLLKNEINLIINNYSNENSAFKLGSLKIYLHAKLYHFIYLYPKYSNKLNNFLNIFINENNNFYNKFIQEIQMKVNICDDLFVLYLIYLSLKK